jgi:hypothetical protein
MGGGEAEGMDVVAWGDRFDFTETGIFQLAGQDYVANQVIAPEAYGGEAHTYLEGDASFFGHHADGAAALYQFCEGAEKGDGAGSFVGKMLAQGDARAEVRLVTVGEEPGAFRAFPEWWRRHSVPDSNAN